MSIRDFDDFAVGEEVSMERVVTSDDVARFVAVTGDDNPIHVDEEYATRLGVGGRIVHGMLTASFVSTVIGTLLPGPGALWLSESFRFRAPVRIDDRLRIEVRIRHLSPGTRILVLDVSIKNQHGSVVLDGEAQVHVLDTLSPMTEGSPLARTAIVTGAGRGIGAAVAERLAADGLQVVVNYRADETQAKRTVGAIEAEGGTAASYRADVSDPGQVTDLVRFALDTYGSVDVIVNNAGSPTDPKPLTELEWDDIERHLATHVRGSFLCIQAVLPGMIERRFGRIINITSQAAYGTPPVKMTGYVVAKASLAALTRCVALEVGPQGITANALAPGMADTSMVADVPQRTKLALAAQSPLRRLASTEDVAAAVSFLAGPGGGYVTGQTIHLSGGQVMA